MVRIAFHKELIDKCIETAIEIKKLGIKVSVNAMATNNYTPDELNYLIKKVNEHSIDYLYIVDSNGNFYNNDIINYYNYVKERLNLHTKIGIHLHNNMNSALSNYNKLLEKNQDIIVDTTLFGIGRGAGNLQTELVLLQSGKMNIKYI